MVDNTTKLTEINNGIKNNETLKEVEDHPIYSEQ